MSPIDAGDASIRCATEANASRLQERSNQKNDADELYLLSTQQTLRLYRTVRYEYADDFLGTCGISAQHLPLPKRGQCVFDQALAEER